MTFFKTILTTSALALLTVSAQAQDVVRVAGNFATEHSSSLAMVKFEEELERLSGGAIKPNFISPVSVWSGKAIRVPFKRVGFCDAFYFAEN